MQWHQKNAESLGAKYIMTRRIFPWLLCVCLFTIVWSPLLRAQEETPKAPKPEVPKIEVPKIEVDSLFYDFKKVAKGDVVRHDFRIINRGNAVLQIKQVKPG